MREKPDSTITRRQLLAGAAGGAVFSTGLHATEARPLVPPQTLTGNSFDLNIGYRDVNFTGRSRIATTINGSLPGPVIRWRQGEEVSLRVSNNLAVDSSIHWHGILLPPGMDGVPNVSFPGIRPGEVFEYAFRVEQTGTYWYHSHSGFQEQTGMYGAIVIDPRDADPVSADRDYVVMLSDWSDDSPERVYRRLKKASHYYNFSQRTAFDVARDLKKDGLADVWRDRAMWNRMRMSDSDLADVNGYTYTFLVNGRPPADPWAALFNRGERVRLRFINGAAMTFFDVRIPGLKMKVVAADGQYVEPVTVDEFRIGVAETYDVIVEPESDSAYPIFAQAMDRSGFALGSLTSDPGLTVQPPSLDPMQKLTHRDMGMLHGDHGAGHGGGHGSGDSAMPDSGHGQGHGHNQRDDNRHAGHQAARDPAMPAKAGFGSQAPVVHIANEFGPQVDMRAEVPNTDLSDPGIGLRGSTRRVLTYADLFHLGPAPDLRDPEREVQLHLTGNMARYMWSINGQKFSDSEPLQFRHRERLRIVLVNDTMMNHPMHLHGMWSDLETGDGERLPRKHTVVVQPGQKISYLVTAEEIGEWAYHCHLLYHMPGMFRTVMIS